MSVPPYSDEAVRAAVEAIAESDRLRRAESAVAAAAPHLQKLLAGALGDAGWFGDTHEAEVLKAATVPNTEQRLTAIRTLLAEETRLGMMVGVAVGWAVAEELRAANAEQHDPDAPAASAMEE